MLYPFEGWVELTTKSHRINKVIHGIPKIFHKIYGGGICLCIIPHLTAGPLAYCVVILPMPVEKAEPLRYSKCIR